MSQKQYETRYMNEVAILRMLGIKHSSLRSENKTVMFLFSDKVFDCRLKVVRIGDIYVLASSMPTDVPDIIERSVTIQVLGGLIRSRLLFVEAISFCEQLKEVKRIIRETIQPDGNRK